MPAERRAELVATLRRLVACPSVTGEPSTVVDLLADELTALGCEPTTVPVGPSASAGSPEHSPPTWVRGPQPPALLGAFPGDGPELLLFAHTDTERVHPGWTSDPFDLRVEGDRAAGLGSADDKGGVVAVLGAVREWQERGGTGWRPRVLFAAGKQGAASARSLGVQAALGVHAALYSHPAESGAGLTQLKVASRGIVTCRVGVPGFTPQPVEERTPVSADPDAGRNAADRAARLAAAVGEWRDESRVWSVTGLRAGGVAVRGARPCRDRRVVLVLRRHRRRRRRGRAGADRRRRRLGARPSYRPSRPSACAPIRPPAPTPPSPDRWPRSSPRNTGRRPSEYSWHSASDIRFPMRVLGVPAVGLGARGGGFYGPGEWVDLDSLDASAGRARRRPLCWPSVTGKVTTVLGEIPAEELGRCLPHEHLVCDFSPVTGDLDHVLNEVELAVDELDLFRSAGGRAVVEVTPPDLGRDPGRLQDISRRSGVHVVMGAGWYRRAFYPEHLDRTPTAALAEAMVAELTEGVLGVRAGVIGEIGCDGGYLTAVEERVLRAAGRAAAVTGAALTTHASMHPVGSAQLDVLEEERVDLAKVVIGHCDSHLDPGYHRELLDRGAWVQFDTAGRRHMNPDHRRASALMSLIKEGWIDRLLISSDRCFRSDLAAFGGLGYSHVLTGFRAVLMSLGLTDEEFDILTIRNPAAVLAH